MKNETQTGELEKLLITVAESVKSSVKPREWGGGGGEKVLRLHSVWWITWIFWLREACSLKDVPIVPFNKVSAIVEDHLGNHSWIGKKEYLNYHTKMLKFYPFSLWKILNE